MRSADAPGDVVRDTHPPEERISDVDRQMLRRLAGRVAELAARPIEQEKRRLWTKHNALEPTRPLVFCDPENSWAEIITPDQFECTGELARQWEHRLRKELFWGESMLDDRVIEPWFNVGYVCSWHGWGLRERYEGGENGGAHRWDSPIKDLDDLRGLRFQSVTVDRPATERLLELATAVLGDQAIESAKVADVARFEQAVQVNLDVALCEGVVIVPEQAEHPAVGEDRPLVVR